MLKGLAPIPRIIKTFKKKKEEEEKERKEKVKRKEQQQTQPLLAASLVCKERWKGWMPGTCQGRAEGTWVAITNIHRRHLAL